MSSFSFKTIDVPAAAGTYTYIGVSGLDASGDAVGYYGNVDGDGDGTFHGFIALVNGNGITLDPPGSTNTSVGMTASGVVFGDYTYLNHQYGFVDNGGVFTTFDYGIAEAVPPTVPIAISTDVNGITNAGVVYGDYADYAINNDNQPGWQGFLNNNGVVTLVSFPGANITTLADINAAGTIVGNYEIGGNTNAGWIGHGFVDHNGSFTSIDVPGAYATSVVGISDGGEIAGNYQDNANNNFGFVDNNGVITTISIPGATYTDVEAINAAGEIVGSYIGADSKGHGFIDDHGVITTVDVPGSTYTAIQGVNATGQIFGSYDDSSGNQHGFVGTLPTTTLETAGSTSLVQVGNEYYLESKSTGTGPELTYAGTPWTTGEWGAWAAIGAEATATGYEVAFKLVGSNIYTVWNTDSNGNITTDSIGSIPGTSPAFEVAELNFHQDLNSDGVIGIPGTIESFGATSLVQTGNQYFLDSNNTGTGPELMLGGTPVTVGEFAWTPIGAEQTPSGYEIALKDGATGQYSAWDTDSSGNVTYDPFGGSVSGSSAALEALEPSFHQDLNGDGAIGVLIDSSGSTSLVQVGNDFFLDSNSTGTGPELMYSGTPWTAGEWGAWAPIGAEATATGYEVAFKLVGSNTYTVWNTDSNGNITTDSIGSIPGTSPAFEVAELSFHQDLNSDGVIGIPGTIESSGATSLVQLGNDYFLDSNSTGTGPELMLGGTPVTVGEFAWTPIGAEQTPSGYEIALKDGATGQYSAWDTDSSGNVTYDPFGGSVSGSSVSLELLETNLHQDLNGDGVIGQVVAAGGTLVVPGFDYGPVEFMGSTGSLVLDVSSAFEGQLVNFTGNGNLSSSDQIDLKDVQFGAGAFAFYVGTSSGGTLTVSDTHFDTAHIALVGDYTNSTFTLSNDGSGGTIVIDPVDNQPAASGTLSFSDPDATGTPSVSVTAQNGGTGYLGSFVADLANAANGQDTVGWHFNFDSGPVAQTVTQSYAVSVADHHADGTSSATTQTVSVTIAGAGNDAFVFHPGLGSDTVVNATNSDTIELDGFASVTSHNQLATLLNEAQTGQSQTLFESVNGGHDTLINLGNHDSITLTDVQIADLHASNFIIH